MAHEGLWQQLAPLDGAATARRAGCHYDAPTAAYIVPLLGTEYAVDPSRQRIEPLDAGGPGRSSAYLRDLCLLAYLIHAREVEAAHELVRPEDLPSGQFFFRGPHRVPTHKLEAAFGASPRRLAAAAPGLGARALDMGDGAIEITVLPRVPVTVIVWGGDEEFSPRASVLVDRTAGDHLPLDALHVALDLVVHAVLAAGEA